MATQTSENGPRKRGKKAATQRKVRKLLPVILIIAAVIVVGCGAFAFYMYNYDTTQHGELTFNSGVTVGGVDVKGLTVSAAKEKILSEFHLDSTYDVRVTCQGETYPITNTVESDIDAVLAEAIKLGNEGTAAEKRSARKSLAANPVDEKLTLGWDEEILDEELAAIQEKVDVPAKDAALTGIDSSSNLIFTEGTAGTELDIDDVKAKINDLLTSHDFAANIEATVTTIQPEHTAAEIKAATKKLSSYTSVTTDNENRNENINVACKAITGKILEPGEEFSLNSMTGERTADKGYKNATIFDGGEMVDGLAGGVCQVSSTLFNAVVLSGLTTTERHNHTYAVDYVPYGQDAMVAWSSSDYKFVNNSTGNVLVVMYYYNMTCNAVIYGIPVLEDGVTVKMDVEILEETPMPDRVYQEDTTLAPGEIKFISGGYPYVKAKTYLVTYTDGVETNRVTMFTSTYKAKAPVYARNSGTTQTTTAAATTEAETKKN